MLKNLIAGVCSVALSACATTQSFTPHSVYSIDQDIAELHARFETAASINGYYAGADNVERRNEFIAGRLTLYNLEYLVFVKRFRLSHAQVQGLFEVTQLGLGLATTLVAGERTKTVLGAVTTALTGGKSSYEKTFYNDQTTAALITQMNAERKVALIPILAGARSSIEDYPLTQAIADLAEYQIAGSIDGALQGVQRDAGVKDAKATARIEQYRTVSFKPDDSSMRIKAWLFPGATSFAQDGTASDANGAPVLLDAARFAKLTAEIKALGLNGLPPAQFLGKDTLAADRAKAITHLDIP